MDQLPISSSLNPQHNNDTFLRRASPFATQKTFRTTFYTATYSAPPPNTLSSFNITHSSSIYAPSTLHASSAYPFSISSLRPP
ncbi:hypothetical protein TVAGG3_0564420 [Trichomonas vaginalis G3]|uniref:hypothetical protein n=1 Tax=Trichomonas vaginalis (strain ATCC PRA-98 / G3) TaxID=412133 RepID=UPI0021E55D9D|nr:hypothetical protein TVAGG3_0564420 [Trichomonas vaginalis G3]KAI5521457.1 hypothetical protein TVAGG3_0564420 [Trichomonas vaginalis G3]